MKSQSIASYPIKVTPVITSKYLKFFSKFLIAENREKVETSSMHLVFADECLPMTALFITFILQKIRAVFFLSTRRFINILLEHMAIGLPFSTNI